LSFVCIFMSVTSCPVMFLYIINFVPIIGLHYFLLLFGCFLWLSACFSYFHVIPESLDGFVYAMLYYRLFSLLHKFFMLLSI
jgi:hypothetical protein